MTQVTNNTRDPVALPKKGGGVIDVRGGESVDASDLDTEHAYVKGYLAAGAIAVDTRSKRARQADEAPKA